MIKCGSASHNDANWPIPELTRKGHPRFYELTQSEIDLHDQKNADYAGGGSALGNFERISKILKHYPGLELSSDYVIALIYMLKQLDAALWLICQGKPGQVEGVPERLGDVSVYAKLARIMYEEAHIQQKAATADSSTSSSSAI